MNARSHFHFAQKRFLLIPIAALALAGSAALAQNRGQQPARRANGLADKQPDLPAGVFTAASTLARTKMRHEWADVPVGNVKLHVLIVYPDGGEKAPVVLVMPHEGGLDEWMRAVTDQLAVQGFIAVAPDIFSGLGPKGGNYDSFPFPDDATRAGARLKSDEAMRRYKGALQYGMGLPRASGKSASIGFSSGGSLSFRLAGDAPDLNAAVVFYGMPPDEATMAKIKAPVLAFYGGEDTAVTATVESTTTAMKRLGKSYESHIEPGATHEFMMYQVEGENGAAIVDAWPRAIAFLNEHTR